MLIGSSNCLGTSFGKISIISTDKKLVNRLPVDSHYTFAHIKTKYLTLKGT